MCPTLCSIPLSLYYPIWYQSERPRTAAHASVTVAPGGLRSPGGGQLFFSLFASSSHHPKRSISQAFVLSSIKQQQQRLRSSSISPTTWRTAPARGHPRATVDVWISVGHARPASPLPLGGGGEGGWPPLHLGRRHRAPSAAEDARLLVVLGAAPQPSTLA